MPSLDNRDGALKWVHLQRATTGSVEQKHDVREEEEDKEALAADE